MRNFIILCFAVGVISYFITWQEALFIIFLHPFLHQLLQLHPPVAPAAVPHQVPDPLRQAVYLLGLFNFSGEEGVYDGKLKFVRFKV